MKVTAPAFKANARAAMGDASLRQALGKVQTNFTGKRAAVVADLPEFDRLRDEARAIKDHVLAHLDVYLDRFEHKVREAGGHVHWCRTPREARETILALCRKVEAKTATKGKSMVTEEIGLNPFLAANGIQPIETDLGEYIIQLADEPPSHIIAPAAHKTKDQVSDLFHEHHVKLGYPDRITDPQALVNEARQILRRKYFEADVGITGANFLIAETGSTVTVTNEGNGDLTQILAKMHIVVASIEKAVPTLEDAATLLRVLARSATGQEFSVYTTFSTGARRADDLDGPGEYHVVLLDNGRSDLVGSEIEPVLRCIRCGACMNHCPVYQSVGGHAYGYVYPGPIGAALDPHLIGLEAAQHLPNASTFCGRCEEVCPMRIPLPAIMRHWREQAHESGITPPVQRRAVKAWAWFARHPALYRLGARVAVAALAWLARGRGRFSSLPLAGGFTAARDLPAPAGRTFQDEWRRRDGARR
jgi:L-lactate dehydrogenase complex protein LldF